jgi:hypothetical protein
LISRELISRIHASLLATLLLVGCGYDAHAPNGSPATADGYPTLDAGPSPYPPGSRPTFLSHDEPAVQAAVAAWRERHLIHGDVSSPDGPRCIDAFALESVTVDPRELRRLCGRCDPTDPVPECDELGRASACAPIGALRGSDGELGEQRPLIVVGDSHVEAYAHLVIHQTIHHLGRCTGEGSDDGHTRAHYWCSGGDVCTPDEASESIHSRARVLLPD